MKNFSIITLLMALLVATAHAGNDETFNQMLRLAEHNDAIAQYNVGMFYNNGIGTAKNPKLAFEWFQKSAANNNPLGAYKVGCYYSGQGSEFMAVNHNKALEYKLIAAKAGYTLAQFDVASIEFSNNNVNESIKWLKAASEQGDFGSINSLIGLYYQGNKIPKDFPSAYRYLKMAMKIADGEPPKEVKAMLDELIKNIPSIEREKIDKFVSSWQPKPSPLTLEAQSGLRGAEEYLKKQTGH